MTPPPHPFAKGHGAGNDFIVLPDPEGRLRLTGEMVRSLCDRRTGIGADGVLRAVHCTAAPEAASMAGEAEWFMDYRNPDGSTGAMCGNGIRVLARYLVDTGLSPAGALPIATRAGTRHVHIPRPSARFRGEVTVKMGRPGLPGPDGITVTAAGRTWPALHVDMGNPHAVVLLEDLDQAGGLTTVPAVTPADAFPHGVSVGFAALRGPARIGLRVHERGAGETRACGTGACAAVTAVRTAGLSAAADSYLVDAPGGRLRVAVLPDGTLHLTGPAAVVAQGTIHFTTLTADMDASVTPAA
ncbi:diaminopimelate epimerase [Streptomyces uncialis]|uniref:diaminopimelate epimerase n=1 Tax=Streptomyces uncialis TaxID=1048205 RepID=UPI002E315862|nr:diaminopimelate epimerase [Streptomyces uncialis]